MKKGGGGVLLLLHSYSSTRNIPGAYWTDRGRKSTNEESYPWARKKSNHDNVQEK